MTHSDVLTVNELNFEDEVLRSPVPVLVDVSAPWCAPCRAAEPVVAELARQNQGRLKVVEIDGDQSPDLVARLGVRGFPTFLGYVGGRKVESAAGFYGKKPLFELSARLLSK
jgi:thioredoxin 1